MSDLLYFNGINGATGGYELPPTTPEILAEVIAGQEVDRGFLNDLKEKKEAHWALIEGVSPLDLAQAGWGVIFAHNADPAVKEALSELLDHRKKQAGERYREYVGADGFRVGADSKKDWLARHGTGPGPVDPNIVPYYLLIVGDPETIPYLFQTQLDVQYGVGRIHFDTLEEYAQYARSVVTAETKKLTLPKQITLFGTRAEGDAATTLSADSLVKPLSVSDKVGKLPGWKANTLLEADATKANLSDLINGKSTPTLLFTGSHGMGFPNGDPRQLLHQGALLCQDWPGPGKWKEAIPDKFYFSGNDVSSDAKLLGSMAFFFACYGAGTPKLDQFAQQATKQRTEIAPNAFLAHLPKKLLGHPRGGMLAVVGHVERAWGYSFMWDRAGAQIGVFKDTLTRLMGGQPIGFAFEAFNLRYAEIATELTPKIDDLNFGANVDKAELASLWTAEKDARNYVILGDPAVRLPIAS
jgi:hypothetical protein